MKGFAFRRAGGRRRVITPQALSENAGIRQMGLVLALGTGAVSTQTKIVGIAPVALRVVGISYAGQSAVTGTSITAETKKIAADGSASTSFQSAATDVEFTASTDDEANAAALSATAANLLVDAGQVIECVITCSSITAGPGDFAISVLYVPQEDSGPLVENIEEL